MYESSDCNAPFPHCELFSGAVFPSLVGITVRIYIDLLRPHIPYEILLRTLRLGRHVQRKHGTPSEFPYQSSEHHDMTPELIISGQEQHITGERRQHVLKIKDLHGYFPCPIPY